MLNLTIDRHDREQFYNNNTNENWILLLTVPPDIAFYHIEESYPCWVTSTSTPRQSVKEDWMFGHSGWCHSL